MIEKNHNGAKKMKTKLNAIKKFFSRRKPVYMDWDSYQELINALDDIRLLEEASKNIFKGD